MPEVALYRLDIDAGADRGYGVAVPQIMVTGIGPPNRRNRFLIVAVDRRLRQVMPQRIGEHQVTVLPGTARHETLLGLLDFSVAKAGNHRRGCHQCAAAAILGGNQLIGRKALFLMELELLV